MWSIIEASVVLFPEPVGPVTRTSPLLRKHRSSSAWGSPISAAVRMVLGICRITLPIPFRSSKRFTRKRARGVSWAKSVSLTDSHCSRFFSGVMEKSMSFSRAGASGG
jgi:hypothetical protein